jgi:hypothetical protein
MNRNANGIVLSVSFSINVSDGTDSFVHNFNTALMPPSANPIPYDQLKETDVIDWVKNLVQQESEEQADAELVAWKIRKTLQINTGVPW